MCQFPFIMSLHCRNGPKSKVLRKSDKMTEILLRQKTPGARRKSPGGAHSPQEASRHGQRSTTHGPHLVASLTASRRLFAYKVSPELKTSDHRSFSPETHMSATATKNPNSGDKSYCSGTLPDWEFPWESSSSPLLPPMMRRE